MIRLLNTQMIIIKILKNTTASPPHPRPPTPQKKPRKIFIVFVNMIADMLSNKKFNLLVTELFIRVRKLKISLVLLHNVVLMCQNTLD